MKNKLFPSANTLSKEEMAEMLKTDKDALAAFEEAYKTQVLDDESSQGGFFNMTAKHASKMAPKPEAPATLEMMRLLEDIKDRIIRRLVSKAVVLSVENGKCRVDQKHVTEGIPEVTSDELNQLPPSLRPDLTDNKLKRDTSGESFPVVLDMWRRYCDPKQKNRQLAYHMFRQGLDILDLDPILYEILGMNPNQMGFWLPKICQAVQEEGFFKIPDTKILKVPLTMLQLTRLDYTGLSSTSKDIVNKFCHTVFDLDDGKEYFIKTGTHCSKFDFRNALVKGASEVQELGEYLLFIHNQALMMAGPLVQPSIYGIATTNEWVVREYIPDMEGNPQIYKGLPLHTEYRVFVDFDTKQVLAIHPYWDPDVMKKRFGHEDDADSPHMKHDYVTYLMHEDTLMARYEANKEEVAGHMQAVLDHCETMTGQWSVDIMQNGSDFYLIDMATAETSMFYDDVLEELRRPLPEDWMPEISYTE